MNIDKLNRWADLLLDTGKRNNLVNFRDTKNKTVEILSPDYSTLFNKLEHSTVFEVFDPKIKEDDEDDPLASYQPSQITRLSYINSYSKKLKKNQILVYNVTKTPITAIKNISKTAKSAIEETGVNIAYIALGFINWYEDGNSDTVMKAPILLAPISIENDSPIEPYKIKITDSETIINPTFSYKLAQEFGIKLPDFDEDEGIEAYFEKIKTLTHKLGWTVSTECKIGIFSFLKINMYKDLKDNAPKIIQNGNVRILLGDTSSIKSEQKPTAKTIDLLDIHNVVDSDSSQQEAIKLAKEGKSFVLQGPPGTGKSQTITNVIAECLYDGKKVLFVSEKLAALNVVYDKLHAVGLEEFCLELHSHKTSKKQVIEELCRTLKMQKSCVAEQAEKEIQAKEVSKKQLDDYDEELHQIRPTINRSLYQIYEELSACRTAPTLDYIIENLDKKGSTFIDKASDLLSRYSDFVPSIGQNYRNNLWYGYKNTDCSYSAVYALKNDLSKGVDFCSSILSIDSQLANFSLTNYNISRARFYKDFFGFIKGTKFITPKLLAHKKLSDVSTKIKDLSAVATELFRYKNELDGIFSNDLYNLDGNGLFTSVVVDYDNFVKRLFSKKYKQIATSLKLCLKNPSVKLGYNLIVHYLYLLKTFQKGLAHFNSLLGDLPSLTTSELNGIYTDFSGFDAEIKTLETHLSHGVNLGSLTTDSTENFIASKSAFSKISSAYDKAFKDFGSSEENLKNAFEKKEFNVELSQISILKQKLENCLANISSLDNWCEFRKLIMSIRALGIMPFVDLAITSNVEREQIVSAFRKVFFSEWADLIIRQVPALLELSRIPHDKAVKLFKEKDKLHFEINKAIINARLSEQRPSIDMVAPGSSVSILLREGEKKRKQKGVRVLLSEIGDLIQTIKPCFLMSPLSVSTFLSQDMVFDVVVFDEASQIFPQDAIGAIYRGKQLIVVGDSQQMPPSNFFNSSSDFDTDEEEEDLTDYESILDLCSTALYQCRLKWHYRSRFEQLISFSNKNFYDSDLVTFPSSKKDRRGIGVDYFFVDGTFDRKTRTNLKEAERIVDLVFENFEKYPERSLGVVAFSISQQNLIDKLILKRRKADPSKEEFFKSTKEEPFFVKNLETVQGDERDTIIFSIAYAKDLSGKLLLNFGPINREGGERRLNVAVTRAKYNVQLVTSLHHTDFDLSRTKSKGVKLLCEYLDFAENGTISLNTPNAINLFSRKESEFINEVREFLTQNYYKVDSMIGCSALKIDLAVKHRQYPDYVLAIECDGQTYHSSKTTRDRDRLRQEILERMGWKYYRIWSTDWFRNKELEKTRLLEVVKEAFEKTPIKTENTPSISFEETLEVPHFEFPEYYVCDVNRVASEQNYDLLKILTVIIQTEAPISEEWLLKRICHLFGREKVTSIVVREFELAMQKANPLSFTRKNGFIYLQGAEIPMLRIPTTGDTPRELKHISLEELSKGIREVLRQNVICEKAGLFRLLTTKLGYTRIGDAIITRLEEALTFISSELVINGNMLSLKD